MSLPYKKIIIYTSENARTHGKLLYYTIPEYIRDLKLAARCIVSRGMVGFYENGEIASTNILDLSYNLPITIEIIIPATQLEAILPRLEEMVADGIIAVQDLEVRAYHVTKHLIPEQLRINEIMTSSPKTVAPTTPVSVVINLMQDNNLKGIPVVDEKRQPVGIITPGDLMNKAGLPVRLGLLQKLDPSKVQNFINCIDGKYAQDIMSAPLITVQENQLLKEAVHLMLRRHLKRLPVVNRSGLLVGMLSRIDIFRAISSQAPQWHSLQEQNVSVNNRQPVKDIIERDLETVYPETSISKVIEKISRQEIQRVAVINQNGKFVGLITDNELMPLIAIEPGFWKHLKSKLRETGKKRNIKELIQHTQESTASEIMIANPIMICEDTTIDEAVQLMMEKGIKRLPVVDSEGNFKGMISRDAILQTITS